MVVFGLKQCPDSVGRLPGPCVRSPGTSSAAVSFGPALPNTRSAAASDWSPGTTSRRCPDIPEPRHQHRAAGVEHDDRVRVRCDGRDQRVLRAGASVERSTPSLFDSPTHHRDLRLRAVTASAINASGAADRPRGRRPGASHPEVHMYGPILIVGRDLERDTVAGCFRPRPARCESSRKSHRAPRSGGRAWFAYRTGRRGSGASGRRRCTASRRHRRRRRSHRGRGRRRERSV